MRSLARAATVAAGAVLWATAVLGQPSDDGISWLQRIYSASDRVSYTGTFVYQYGEQVETWRITRIAEPGGVYERLEALDGSPREYVRHNEEVKCYLPQTMTLKIGRQVDTRPFPAMRADPREIAQHYVIRKAETERIAGYDCQAVVLEPRDNLRYGHKLWADIGTGVLVKAKTFNEKGEVVEQFTFTQLQVGGRIDREQVKSRFEGKGRDWRIERSASVPADLAAEGWQLRALPPGYRKITELKGNFGAAVDVGRIVLSDGLAAVSVFIAPLAGKHPEPQFGLARQGALNVYTRKLDAHLVTVVGEVPAESVWLIGNNLEYRRPQ
jgi:sigma-E factor negative regulatory protein RseB